MDLEKGRVARQPVKKLSYVLANITRYKKKNGKNEVQQALPGSTACVHHIFASDDCDLGWLCREQQVNPTALESIQEEMQKRIGTILIFVEKTWQLDECFCKNIKIFHVLFKVLLKMLCNCLQHYVIMPKIYFGTQQNLNFWISTKV